MMRGDCCGNTEMMKDKVTVSHLLG